MTYSGMLFLLFLAATAALYYLCPKKQYQWVILLIASVFFYLYASVRYSIYLLVTILSSYGAARAMAVVNRKRGALLAEKKKEWSKEERKTFKNETQRRLRLICGGTLVLNFGILAVLKYSNFVVQGLGAVLGLPALSGLTLRLILPLGISFYTFQTMGYVIDVCRGTAEAEKNPLKLALFLCFFPQILQGPIDVHSHLAGQLYAEHGFSFEKLRLGCELILWGFLKKLVLADRAYTAIAAVITDYTAYDGSILVFTTLLYALQIYTDFSGGIDISRGAAQILGIDMAENFRRPYFASSVNDYWRRWHISLGAWMKNYLFYPLALSKTVRKVSDRLSGTSFGKTAAGNHVAKSLSSCWATLVVFLVVGIWHGASSRYVGYGLWNGVIISMSILLQPVFRWQNTRLGLSEESRGLQVFRILRTFLLVSISNITDLAPTLRDFFVWVGRSVSCFSLSSGITQLQELGLDQADYWILGAGVLLLFAVGLAQERKPDSCIRERLNGLVLPLRWAVLLAGFTAVLILGCYGPGYDAAAFAYMQF